MFLKRSYINIIKLSKLFIKCTVLFLTTLVLSSLQEAGILLLKIYDPNWVNFDLFICQN